MNQYTEQLCEAMKMLSEHPEAVFLSQACKYPGTAMFGTLRDIPMEKRVEMPVAENMQMGMATGIAMAGGLPICMFPRINFMIDAASQLVQHLDKIPLFSTYRPKVIIRTAIATDNPLDPGVQHMGDYTDAFEKMFSTIKVVRLTSSGIIVPAYQDAMTRDGSTLLVEYSELMIG